MLTARVEKHDALGHSGAERLPLSGVSDVFGVIRTVSQLLTVKSESHYMIILSKFYVEVNYHHWSRKH